MFPLGGRVELLDRTVHREYNRQKGDSSILVSDVQRELRG